MHMEVRIYIIFNSTRYVTSKMKKNMRGKTIINLFFFFHPSFISHLENQMRPILTLYDGRCWWDSVCLVLVYEIFIKLGSGDRILENCRISAGTQLFERIFHQILYKLTCRPKKRSADKFDSFDPSYCQFLIKL